ncbi:uncharacterized protein [Apostichopus japonicus]|uniref:uncharacterized protein n=1 Tax=Stichopus japonicus TaxID=307972 RepID=UPI003AB49777
MAEPNSEATSIKDPTSTIPPEMIPLLAEIEASTEAGKFITLTVPIENESKPTVSTEQSSPGKSPHEGRYRKQKLHSSSKSRVKRKKMEIYVRQSKKFIYVGNQVKRWDQYRKELRIKNDEEFAKLLLDGFRKYTKVVQLVVGPTFGYPESVLGEDNSHSLHPLKKVDDENMSDSDDLTDYVDTVREGIESKEEGAEDGGGEDESEITGMEEDDLTQEGENNTTDQQPEEDKKD